MHLSSTSIVGTDVRNHDGKDLGKIEDIMIETTTGEVQYAVLSFGGFLGIGDKLFAVPMAAMKINTDDETFILDESKERLENAPGFDKDNWPLSSNTQWTQDVRRYYNV